MNTYGFEIKLNGKKICRAGLEEEYYVLSCIMGSHRREDENGEVYINVGGLKSTSMQYVDWVNKTLKKGDMISIEVITNGFDLPARIREQDPEEFLIEQKIKAFYRLKEELRDHLKD